MIVEIKIDLQKWVTVEPKLLENERPTIVGIIIDHLVHYGTLPNCSHVRFFMGWDLKTWEIIGKELCDAFCLVEASPINAEAGPLDQETQT